MTERIKLPPLPTGIFAHSEDDDKLQYTGDLTDINARMRHKLYMTWIYLSYLTGDKEIAKIINTPSKKKTSSEFKLKSYLLNIFDQLGKLLAVTDLPEELFGVKSSEIEGGAPPLNPAEGEKGGGQGGTSVPLLKPDDAHSQQTPGPTD